MKLSSANAFLLCAPLVPLHVAGAAPMALLKEASANLPNVDQRISDGVLKLNDHGKLVLEAGGTEYTLQGGEKLKEKTEEGIAFHLKVSELPGPNSLGVGDYTAKSVGRWLDTTGEQYFKSKNEAKVNLYAKALSLRGKIDQNINQPAGNQDWKGLYEQYDSLKTLVRVAQVDETDPALRAELTIFQSNLEQEQRTFLANKLTDKATAKPAEQYVEKKVPVVEKRFYRMNDNYRPEIYPLIFAHSFACVAIVRNGSSVPIGSGALIAPNLVLTCRHNIDENYADEFDSTEYRVWLDFEERLISTRKLNTEVFLAKEVYRSNSLDFSLLEIQKNSEERIEVVAQPESGTDLYSKMVDLYPGIGGSRPVLPLNGNTFPRWTPVFVVGHPNGKARIVHDSSWLLFPHQLRSKADWGYIEGQVTDDYRDFEFLPYEEATIKARQFMERVYGKLKPDQPKTVYTLTEDGEEYMGIESDTFKGDSGAPVMLRENGSLIGILYKGMGDSGQSPNTPDRQPKMRLIPSADNHERVLPMTLILKELNSQNLYPNWKAAVKISR